ncbi:hypothetical protein TNCV_866631 [Trichonephila clavipes]|nr:hypothetical protein TNCV_866631 [Trichonephila clavipes]
MSLSPVPLKTRRAEQRCTLKLPRAETSSRSCGVVVRRGGASSGQETPFLSPPTPQRRYFKILTNVTFDDGLPIFATEVQETVDLSQAMNSDPDAEIENETLIKTVTFLNALHCL